MRSLVTVIPALVLATGCLDTAHHYDVVATWTTENPPETIGTARLTYPENTIDGRGYNGQLRFMGETPSETIEVCLVLGEIELVQDESTYCKLHGCEPAPELVPYADRQCQTISVDTATVAFAF